MNPQLLLLLMSKNGDNIKNIINVIGIENLFKLVPDFVAIMETLQAPKAGA